MDGNEYAGVLKIDSLGLNIDGTNGKTRVINVSYFLYFLILIFSGAFHQHLNTFAAGIFLAILYVWYGRYLVGLKIDVLLFFALISILIPLAPLLLNEKMVFTQILQELVKYYALSFVLLIGLSLPFPALNLNRTNWVLYLTILAFLLLGWFWPGGYGIDQGRVRGFLANPNNFALTAMLLLLLVDEKSTKAPFKVINYFLVVYLVYVSKTGGAIVGIMCGFCYKFIMLDRGYSTVRLLKVGLAFLLVAAVFIALPDNTFNPLDKTIEKITIAQESTQTILNNKQVDYLQIAERTGDEHSSSLTWRFQHWHKIFTSFLGSSIDQMLIGHGIGMSDVDFGLKPHNDYLRILYETGIFGLLFIALIWFIIYQRMEIRHKWIVVMVAIYCFTENNYDHFPAMSLILLFMLSANKEHTPEEASQLEV